MRGEERKREEELDQTQTRSGWVLKGYYDQERRKLPFTRCNI